MKVDFVRLAVALFLASASVQSVDAVLAYIKDGNRYSAAVDRHNVDSVADDFFALKVGGVELDVSGLTVEEAKILPRSVCMKFDTECMKALLKKSGGEHMLNRLSGLCVNSIPYDVFAGILPEDVPALGESFLEMMNPSQLSSLSKKSFKALTDKQIAVLLKSSNTHLEEPGHLCSGLRSSDISYLEKERPTALKSLTPECVRFLDDGLAGVGPNILKTPRLFSKTPIDKIVHLPKGKISTALVNSILSKPDLNCQTLTTEVLDLIPTGSYPLLGKECWREVGREKGSGKRKPLHITFKLLSSLPENAWTLVSSEFISNVRVSGKGKSDKLGKVLAKIGEENSHEACKEIDSLMCQLDHSLIAHLSPPCIRRLSPEFISEITSSKALAALPAHAIAEFNNRKVTAIPVDLFKSLPETFFAALGAESESSGCAGLTSEQINAVGHASKVLKAITPLCVVRISASTLSMINRELISKFSDEAFSLLNRMDFKEDDGVAITDLLAAMRPEQIKMFGDAATNELHICHGVVLDVEKVMTGGLKSTSQSQRMAQLGPILSTTCLPFVHSQSMEKFPVTGMQYMDEKFLSLLKNPRAVRHLPSDSLKTATQAQIDMMSLSGCAGLDAEKILSLGKHAKLTLLECLQRVEPKHFGELFERREKLALSKNLASILTSKHMEIVDLKKLKAEDLETLGSAVPEALHPCAAISATEVEPTFWKHVDEYCVAAIRELSKVPFEHIEKHMHPSKLALIGSHKASSLEKKWKVKIQLATSGTSQMTRSEDGVVITSVMARHD